MTTQTLSFKKIALVLLSVFGLWLLFLLPTANQIVYYYDDHNHFKRIHAALENPAALAAPDEKDHRRAPLSVAVFCLIYLFSGLKPEGYFLVLYLFHFFNALLISRLALRLNLPPAAALFAGLFFLCSGSFYRIMLALSGLTRVLTLFFFILAALAWLKYLDHPAKKNWLKTLLYQVLSLLASPAAIVFPAMAGLWALLRVPGRQNKLKVLAGAVMPFAVIFILLFLWLWADLFSPHRSGRWLAGSDPFFLIQKGLSLLRMLFIPLLVPEKGLLGPESLQTFAQRLAPASCILLGFALFIPVKEWPAAARALRNPALSFSLSWIVMTAILHMPYPSMFEHTSRYLYLPMAGFCLWLGAFWARIQTLCQERWKRAGLIFFCFVTFFILALNTLTVLHYRTIYREYGSLHPEFVYQDEIESLFQDKENS